MNSVHAFTHTSFKEIRSLNSNELSIGITIGIPRSTRRLSLEDEREGGRNFKASEVRQDKSPREKFNG